MPLSKTPGSRIHTASHFAKMVNLTYRLGPRHRRKGGFRAYGLIGRNPDGRDS